MDELEQWQLNNEAYLAKALTWLRLRLLRLAPQQQMIVSATMDLAVAPKRPLWGRSSEALPTALPALPPPSSNVTDEQLAQALAEMQAAEAATPAPAIRMLSQTLGLTSFEQHILLLCTAMELDTRIASLCALVQDDVQRAFPTFALALVLFDEANWHALSPEGALRRWRLIEINQPNAQPLTTSPLRADERIVNYLKGLNYLDDRLAPLFVELDIAGPPAELPPSQQSIADQIVAQFRQSAAMRRLPIIQLLGGDSASKQLIAWRVAASLGLQLYRLPAETIPTHAAELETLARLIDRETALWPLALYIDAQEIDKPAEGSAPPLNRFLSRSSGVCFLDTRDIGQGVGRATATFDIAKPTRAEQQAIWLAALGDTDEAVAARVSGQFDLNVTSIQQIAQSALAGAASDQHTPLGDGLWQACLAATRPRMDALAQRIEPRATWDDLVLPATEMNLLRQVAMQVQHRHTVYEQGGFAAKRARGLSINALFAGESGTGKTTAAEVIANDLRLNLYRIDLSAVVSKYIGETEKNLRRLFDAAEDGGALLFFDEADALFGKRSEVKDSHDRYANIEINYLLQRMESYQGLAILATNMKSALDPAFMRRIRFVVEFRPHGLAERKAIWERIFPPETRTEGLDFDRLARLALNGGSINNVAINTAFLAAQAGTPVTMPLVLEAGRAEFVKLKRPFNNNDFE
ncbi:MAG: ATP-binding protein [Roseiflexaceae bacterium]